MCTQELVIFDIHHCIHTYAFGHRVQNCLVWCQVDGVLVRVRTEIQRTTLHRTAVHVLSVCM
jgi:hypothetical protein